MSFILSKEIKYKLKEIRKNFPKVSQNVFEQNYLKPFDSFKKKYNLYKGDVERISHGAQHVSRVAGYIPALVTLARTWGIQEALDLTEDDVTLLQLVALFHDAARQDDESQDKWEMESAQKCEEFLKSINIPTDIIKKLKEIILKKEKADFLGKLFQTADSFDIMRVREEFNLEKTALFSYCDDEKKLETLKALSIEIRQLIADQHDLKHPCKIKIYNKEIAPSINATRDQAKPHLKAQYEHSEYCYRRVTNDFPKFPLLSNLLKQYFQQNNQKSEKNLSENQLDTIKRNSHISFFITHSQKQAKVLKELTAEKNLPQGSPIGRMTQSEALLKLTLKEKYKPENLTENIKSFLKMYDEFYETKTAEDLSLRARCEEIIQAEKNNPDKLVFYHAAKAEIGFIYTVFSGFRKLLLQNSSTHLIALRAFDELFKDIEGIEKFIERMDRESKSSDKYNYRKGYQARGLSLNPSFLASNYQYEASSTFYYWLNSYSEAPPPIGEILCHFFTHLGFSETDVFLQTKLFLNFFENNLSKDNSVLLQFLVNPNVADKIAYISEVVGDRLQLTLHEGESPTFKPSVILKALREDCEKFEITLKKNRSNFKNQKGRPKFVVQDPDFLYAGVVEARLLADSKYFQKENDVKIEKYFYGLKNEKKYFEKLDNLILDTTEKLLSKRQFKLPATRFSQAPVLQVVHDSYLEHEGKSLPSHSNLLIDWIESENIEKLDSYFASRKPEERFTEKIQLAVGLESMVFEVIIEKRKKELLKRYLECYPDSFENEQYSSIFIYGILKYYYLEGEYSDFFLWCLEKKIMVFNFVKFNIDHKKWDKIIEWLNSKKKLHLIYDYIDPQGESLLHKIFYCYLNDSEEIRNKIIKSFLKFVPVDYLHKSNPERQKLFEFSLKRRDYRLACSFIESGVDFSHISIFQIYELGLTAIDNRYSEVIDKFIQKKPSLKYLWNIKMRCLNSPARIIQITL